MVIFLGDGKHDIALTTENQGGKHTGLFQVLLRCYATTGAAGPRIRQGFTQFL